MLHESLALVQKQLVFRPHSQTSVVAEREVTARETVVTVARGRAPELLELNATEALAVTVS